MEDGRWEMGGGSEEAHASLGSITLVWLDGWLQAAAPVCWGLTGGSQPASQARGRQGHELHQLRHSRRAPVSAWAAVQAEVTDAR